MGFREDLQEALKKVLKELDFPEIEPQIEHPENPEHGDYATNIALVAAKKLGKSPMEITKEITEKLKVKSKKLKVIERIDFVEPGFINFWLSHHSLSKELGLALKSGERYPSTHFVRSGQVFMVEFAHPNTHKEFHIGHLRNITLGESLCRLFEFTGATVTRANYQGDIGLHIAKAIWGVREIGDIREVRDVGERASFLAGAYVSGNKAYNEDEKAKAEIERINKKLYQGDPELTKLWKETRRWSLEYFDSIYKRFGTKFDRLYFESEVAQSGLDIVSKSLDTVFEKSDGAVIYPGERYGLHNRVFINSLGLPTYEAKDIGLAQLQFSEFNPNKVIHVVGPEQTEYFRVVFSALERLLPETKGREYHLPYGWVRLKTGKMSSRTGDVVAAIWLLDETKKRLKESYKMEDDVAEVVAVGAVKYSMLRLHPRSEIAFDIDESIRLDGDSGPYLQYTYARAHSVLRKAGERRVLSLDSPSAIPPGNNSGAPSLGLPVFAPPVALEQEELSLLRTFYKFPEVVEAAATQYAPNLLCSFLYDLASKYNLLYNNLSILGEGRGNGGDTGNWEKVRKFRLALTQATANILKTGLGLLGISAPERM